MDSEVRVAIVGVGNCASSLVQGVFYYQNAGDEEFIPGLMHPNLGGIRIRDIKFVAAFDVNATKVGKDLSEAIFAPPNNTTIFHRDVPNLGVPVMKGYVGDGIGEYLKDVVKIAPGDPVDVRRVLEETRADVLVNYLPVGSEEATKWYVQQALDAGVAVVNAIPVFIARDPQWRKKFEEKNVPIIGDDIKSQVGATILHRTLVNLFIARGMIVDRTYQLNVGGNTDFLNMLERKRLTTKRVSKTYAVTSQFERAGIQIPEENVYIGPSDYVSWLKDNKVAYIRIEGRHFGDVPMTLECRLSVEDSPNSAGVVIDAIRLLKLAKLAGIGGALEGPSAYLMKSPPVQHDDETARKMVEKFIEKHKIAKNTKQ